MPNKLWGIWGISSRMGKSYTAPTIFFIFSAYFSFKQKNILQTTFVPTFWTHIISELGGVSVLMQQADTDKNEHNPPQIFIKKFLGARFGFL